MKQAHNRLAQGKSLVFAFSLEVETAPFSLLPPLFFFTLNNFLYSGPSYSEIKNTFCRIAIFHIFTLRSI